MSSLKLAQAINARGVYSIGKLDNGTSTQLYDKKNVHSVISLLLLPDKNTGQARESIWRNFRNCKVNWLSSQERIHRVRRTYETLER